MDTEIMKADSDKVQKTYPEWGGRGIVYDTRTPSIMIISLGYELHVTYARLALFTQTREDIHKVELVIL